MKSFKQQVKPTVAGGTAGGASKVVDTFDVPFTMEQNGIKITVKIDNQPVEVYWSLAAPEVSMSSIQLAAIDSSYLADLTEESRITDDAMNTMFTKITKRGYLRLITLGKAEKRHVPMLIVDQGPLKYLAAWTSMYGRPLLPSRLFTDWRFEIMTDLKIIRFIRGAGNGGN